MTLKIEKKALRAWAESQRPEFERILKQLVDIPTVSAQPQHRDDIYRGVDLAVATIERFGGKAEVIKTKGYPIVHGGWRTRAKAPSITVYNHLDVQPASRDTEPWDSDPFLMTIEGDNYLGRGTTDDKGPALSALFGIKAAQEADLPLHCNVLWEFEEEIGSPNFEAGIKDVKAKIATDSVLVSDTIWISRKQPAMSAGLRGLQGFLLKLQTGETDQHSGVAGGAARNPIGELMKLVSEMYDAQTGKVKIKGFYDDIEPLTKKDLAGFVASGFSVSKFKKDHLFRSIRTEDPVEVMRRIWAMPTFEVHGVVGGYTGPGMKTIIPPAAEVKVTCRLVPNQDPRKIMKLVRNFVKERNPDVKVEAMDAMYPYKAPTTGPLAESIRRAIEFSFGKEPVFVREGGSIGAVTSMERVLECPVMFLGLSLPEHGYHAPNERFDWQQASGGMVAFAKYFSELATGA
jgi:acetylornithine deacetylase/succinyl-diaminopimelate desuccinylase-like protein